MDVDLQFRLRSFGLDSEQLFGFPPAGIGAVFFLQTKRLALPDKDR